MSMPTVSVIIPCYNYGHLLGETLETVALQTLSDWECIVIDDGSTDNTVEVVREFAKSDERFKLFEVPNGGPSPARNFGVAMARGKYIQFLDADDLIENRKLEAQVDFLEKHPNVDLVYGEAATFQINESTNLFDTNNLNLSTYNSLPRVTASGDVLIRTLMRSNIMVISSPLIRKTLLDNLGRRDIFLPSLIGNEDWELWLRGALRGAYYEFQALPGSRTLIRLHSSSWSRAGVRMIETWAQMHQLLGPEVKNTPYAALNARGFSFAMFNLMQEHQRQGAKYRALQTIREMRKKTRTWFFLLRWMGWLGLKHPLGVKLWKILKQVRGSA